VATFSFILLKSIDLKVSSEIIFSARHTKTEKNQKTLMTAEMLLNSQTSKTLTNKPD